MHKSKAYNDSAYTYRGKLLVNKRINKAINEYIIFLKKYYSSKILAAVLFGSAARGESKRESDADILIITSESNALIKDEISMSAYEIMLKNNVVLSPVVMDKKTFNWYKKNRDPFYKNVRKDGVELWTRKQESLLKSA